MNLRDYIGMRGETIFAYLIGKKCNGQFWFHTDFLGAKAEAKDFTVYLIGSSTGEATFFVQVKATSKGYTGKGVNRKLRVRVGKKDVNKLKRVTGPAYVAGIDTELEVGFLVAITSVTGDGLSGIPCNHPIDCTLIPELWKEVDKYWSKKVMLAQKSMFS